MLLLSLGLQPFSDRSSATIHTVTGCALADSRFDPFSGECITGKAGTLAESWLVSFFGLAYRPVAWFQGRLILRPGISLREQARAAAASQGLTGDSH